MLHQIFVICVLLSAVCPGATGVSNDVLEQFNAWLESGHRAVNANAYSRVERQTSGGHALQIIFTHSNASMQSPAKVSLPMKSHVLGKSFVQTRPYASILEILKGTNTESEILSLTLSLMTEIAIWDSSPLRPWCQFLLKEPKSIGLSTPPLLWPRTLAEELEPRSLVDAVRKRRQLLERQYDSTQTKSIVSELQAFVNQTLASDPHKHGEFSFSVRNYIRTRAIVESCSLWMSPGGFACVPFGNFINVRASTLSNVKDRYMQQTMMEPFVRRLSGDTAAVHEEVLSFSPNVRDILMPMSTSHESYYVPEVTTNNAFAVDEYFATFGRLPTRVEWESTDCQLVVFTQGLSRERNSAKAALANLLDDFLHHYSCVAHNEIPSHGLVAALISELPSYTPNSFQHCASNVVTRSPPIDEVLMHSCYKGLLSCLQQASWRSPSELTALMKAHRMALYKSILLYQQQQFRSEESRFKRDEERFLKFETDGKSNEGSETERRAATTLRVMRRRTISTILSQLKFDVSEDIDGEL